MIPFTGTMEAEIYRNLEKVIPTANNLDATYVGLLMFRAMWKDWHC